MKIKIFFLLAFLYSNILSQFNAVQVFKECADAVVYIEAGEISVGTGFFINSSGWILTNSHVVEDINKNTLNAEEISIRTKKGNYFPVEKIKNLRPYYRLDLAIIKINSTPDKYLPLLDRSDAEVGEDVVAIGHPSGLAWTQTRGTVTNTTDETFLQIDVAVNPGNSGGPLINKFGQVVGVVTASWRDMQNTNLAIKSSKVKNVLTSERILFTTNQFIKPDEASISGKSKQELELQMELEKERIKLEQEKMRIQYEHEKELRKIQQKKELEKQQAELERERELEQKRIKEIRSTYPKMFSISLLGGYSVYSGLVENIMTNEKTKAWNISAKLSYRFDTQHINERGNLLSLFISYGGSDQNFTSSLIIDQSKLPPLNEELFQSYLEFEGGIILQEWFRLSAGYGTQKIINNGKYQIPTLEQSKYKTFTENKYNYFIGTTGIFMRIGIIDFGGNFNILFGGSLEKAVTRINAFAGLRFDFGQW